MGTDPNPELPIDPDLPAEADDAPGAARRHSASHDGISRPRDLDIVLVVAAGGAIGGAARYGLNLWLPTQPGGVPWSTFAENVTGCFLLGALMVFLLDVWRPGRYLRPFLGVGVLGGFTTFSTYTTDTLALVRGGELPLALAYAFGTLASALLASWAGIRAARFMSGGVPPRAQRRSA